MFAVSKKNYEGAHTLTMDKFAHAQAANQLP